MLSRSRRSRSLTALEGSPKSLRAKANLTGLGFRVSGLGFRVLEFRVLGFWVLGF